KWHYGSHYSSAGIVALFLIRLEPFTQHYVRLQSGRFDVPDRIFCNIQSSWCVSTPSHVSSVSCRAQCVPCCSSVPKGNRHRARRAISTCRTCASSSPNSCTPRSPLVSLEDELWLTSVCVVSCSYLPEF